MKRSRSAIMRQTEVRALPLHHIGDPAFTLREDSGDADIVPLGCSLKRVGPLTPLIVRPKKSGRFELVAGSRRLRAARKFSLGEFPVVIASNLNDRDALLVSLSENMHRRALSPLEEARAMLELLGRHKMTIMTLAQELGHHENFIKVRLQLLQLPEDVQVLVAKKKLGVASAQLIATAGSPEEQRTLAKRVVAKKLTQGDLAVHMRGMKAVRSEQKRPKRLTSEQVRLRIVDIIGWIDRIPTTIQDASSSEKASVAKELGDLVAITKKAIVGLGR